jgi:gluconokinase
MIVLLMGVSGAGKTTVGKRLAERLHVRFHEGDEYHSEANRLKMSQGIPLRDEDREPWLKAIHDLIVSLQSGGAGAVIACSALKRSYRDRLRLPGVRFVFLKAAPEVLQERLARRGGHFFDPRLLQSQLDTLEEPKRAVVVDADQPVEDVVSEIVQALSGSLQDDR